MKNTGNVKSTASNTRAQCWTRHVPRSWPAPPEPAFRPVPTPPRPAGQAGNFWELGDGRHLTPGLCLRPRPAPRPTLTSRPREKPVSACL